MNPYFALSAIFALGIRGIEKKMKLSAPPISQLSPEDKKTGKVRKYLIFPWTSMVTLRYLRSIFRFRCSRNHWKQQPSV